MNLPAHPMMRRDLWRVMWHWSCDLTHLMIATPLFFVGIYRNHPEIASDRILNYGLCVGWGTRPVSWKGDIPYVNVRWLLREEGPSLWDLHVRQHRG